MPQRPSLLKLLYDRKSFEDVNLLLNFTTSKSKITREQKERINAIKKNNEIGKDVQYANENGQQHNKLIRLIAQVFGVKLGKNHYAESENIPKQKDIPHWTHVVNEGYTFAHTAFKSCIDASKPDFVLYDNRFAPSSASIVTIIEIYKDENNADIEKHFEKLVDCNERVLESQCHRQFIISVISSLNYIRFVKSSKFNGSKVAHTFTDSLCVQEQDHFDFLIQLLLNNELNGYVSSTFEFELEVSKEVQTILSRALNQPSGRGRDRTNVRSRS